MRQWMRALAGAVVLATMSAGVAAAQERSGFFFGIGAGYGSLGASDCDGCGREGGFSGHLRLGGVLNPQLLLGVETTGWYKDQDGATLSNGTLTGNVYFYPSKTTGLFVKGGLGLGTTYASVSGFGSNTDTGFGWQVGTGYDIRIGHNTAITPTATYFMGHFDGYSTNVIQIALAFSLY
jgi:hypothetical protein